MHEHLVAGLVRLLARVDLWSLLGAGFMVVLAIAILERAWSKISKRAGWEKRPPLGPTAAGVLDRLEKIKRLKQADPSDRETAEELLRELDALAVKLDVMGENQAALAAALQAVMVHARLAERHPGSFDETLNRRLMDCEARATSVGDVEHSFRLAQQRAAVLRRMAAQLPEQHEIALAACLHDLAIMQAELGRGRSGLADAREAETIVRRWAANRPDSWSEFHALVLFTLANRLLDVGDAATASTTIAEVVAIRRRLAALDPAHEPALAVALVNLGHALEVRGDRDGVLAAARESTEIYRRLAAHDGAGHAAGLALSLNNLSGALRAVGDYAGTIAAAREAIEIRRKLVVQLPGRFEGDLGISLYNLAAPLADREEFAEAREVANEAAAMLRPAAARLPARFAETLVRALRVVAQCATAAGDAHGAQAAQDEMLRNAQGQAFEFAIARGRISNPVLGMLNLDGERTRAVVDQDLARIGVGFSGRVVLSEGAVPTCDILFVYGALAADGTVNGSGISLAEAVGRSSAQLLVVATEVDREAVQNGVPLGTSDHAKSEIVCNIVVTLDRKGDRFAEFFAALFNRMREGMPLALAWNALAPQAGGEEHDRLPQTFCVMPAGHVTFGTS